MWPVDDGGVSWFDHLRGSEVIDVWMEEIATGQTWWAENQQMRLEQHKQQEEEEGESKEKKKVDRDLKLTQTQKKEIIKILGRMSDLTATSKQMEAKTYIYLVLLSSREDKRGKKLIRWASVRLGNSHMSAEMAFKPHFSNSSPLLSTPFRHLRDFFAGIENMKYENMKL